MISMHFALISLLLLALVSSTLAFSSNNRPAAADLMKRPSTAARTSNGLHAAAVTLPVPSARGVESPSKATLEASIINLTKNAVGAGVFSLSAKLLAVSALNSGLLLRNAVTLIFVFAAWAAYSFYMVTEVSRMTEAATYPECWARSVSENTRWVIQGILTIAPLLGCLANTIVLTDLTGSLMQSIGVPISVSGNRNAVALLLCAGVMYPLCSLPDLKAMQGTSLLGLAGQVIAMCVVGIRVWDKSYLPGGKFAPVAIADAVSTAQGTSVLKWFPFAALLSYCYVTHYNAPKYLTELKGNSQARTGAMIGVSYLSAALFYAISLYLGIAAFGSSVKPYLLSNLSPYDPLASVARISIAASILASTPLMFINVRNWLASVAQRRLPIVGHTRRMAALLVFGMGALATRLTDIGKIGSVAGAVFGTNMMFTLPPLMYLGALRQRAQKVGRKLSAWTVGVHVLLVGCGATLSTVAAYHSILALF